MYAKTPTKLTLARWAELMGINPLHFAGVQLDGDGNTPDLQNATGCSQPWPQYSWQAHDSESRESVAEAIATAEANIEAALGYRLLPEWQVDEWRPTARPYRPELVQYGTYDLRGFYRTIETRWGMVVSGGQRAVDTIEEGAAITWSDGDSDNYKETGTVSVATTVTDSEEIRVYYPGHLGEDGYEIRPVSIDLSGGMATITFSRHLAVAEARNEALVWSAAPGDDDAAFLTTVDVGRVYNDPSTMATLVWEPADWCGCDIVGSGTCSICSYTVQTACILPRKPDLGLIAYHPASYDAATDSWSEVTPAVDRDPDLVRLWYRAGLRDMGRQWPTRELSADWERAVAFYAASLLDRGVCSCASAAVARWQVDLAAERGAEELETYRSTPALLDNPLGTRRGAVYAWRRVTAPNVRLAKQAVVL